MVGSFGFEACKAGRSPARSLWAGALLALGLIVAASHSAWAQEDPPGRVGRLNYLQGSVSFSPAGSDEWVEAGTTRPITSGDRLWNGREARSELSMGSTVIRSNEQTALKVLQLDDDQAQFQLSEGSVAVHVRNLDPDDRLEIATPDLAFVIDRPGDYRIDVDPDRNTTTIAVEHGQGTAYADDGQQRLSAPSYARFGPQGLDQVSTDLPRRDAFDRWVEARNERAESRPAARYVPRDLVGYEDLDDYGSWREEPDYGHVWVPRVTVSTWAPYRHGHWAWIAPWGWTWVDDQPWGFAPFHYGRWAYVRSRWCWVPGPVVRRPYYAPALVAFVGTPGGASLSLSSGPAVAWFPLGPREEYRPVYRASPTYVTRINRIVVLERERRGGREPRHGEFANRYIPGAATALSARAFVEGRSVAREQVRVADRELRDAPVVGTMPALAPVQASLVGQRRRLEPPPRKAVERQVVTTRMPAPPPVDRDELARRFAQSGTRVRDAGPALASRREEGREERALRVINPRRESDQPGEERRSLATPQQGERRAIAPQQAAPQQQLAPPQANRPPQERDRDKVIRELRGDDGRPERERPGRAQEADRPAETQRAAPELRPSPRQEPAARPEAAEPARRRPQEGREANRPPQERDRDRAIRELRGDDGRPERERPGRAQEADRPSEAQRAAPELRRQEPSARPEFAEPARRPQEVREALRAAPERREEGPRSPRQEAAPALLPRPERSEERMRAPDEARSMPEMRRERAPEAERRVVERPTPQAAPPQQQLRPERSQPRVETPRAEPQERQRSEGGGREHKDQRERDLRERGNPMRPGQTE